MLYSTRLWGSCFRNEDKNRKTLRRLLTLSQHLEINKDLFDFNGRNIFGYSVNPCRVAKIQQQTLSDSDDVQLVAFLLLPFKQLAVSFWTEKQRDDTFYHICWKAFAKFVDQTLNRFSLAFISKHRKIKNFFLTKRKKRAKANTVTEVLLFTADMPRTQLNIAQIASLPEYTVVRNHQSEQDQVANDLFTKVALLQAPCMVALIALKITPCLWQSSTIIAGAKVITFVASTWTFLKQSGPVRGHDGMVYPTENLPPKLGETKTIAICLFRKCNLFKHGAFLWPGWSGSGSVIQDHSGHGASNEPMNPLWTRILWLFYPDQDHSKFEN